MLQIDESTFSKLSKDDYSVFIDSCVRFVFDLFPDMNAMSGPATIESQVHRAIESAARIGFQIESEVLGFVYIHFLLGADFMAQPRYEWLTSLLRDPTVSQRERVHLALHEIAVRMEQARPLEDLVRTELAQVFATAARLNA